MKRLLSKKNFITELALILGLTISILIGSITSFALDVEHITDSVLRFHILANSDSEADQALKLQVRDAVLRETAVIFENTSDIDSAIAAAEAVLPEIERIATETITANGYSYPVNATITKMPFDKRVYGDITMPAGVYNAVRITIGEAKGQNWWCVMFPPLCIPAVAMMETEAIDVFNVVLSEHEEELLTNPGKYEARFFIVDMINKIRE
jgi:stage II sporulation protein R